MFHEFFSSVNFYILMVDVVILLVAIGLILSAFYKKKHGKHYLNTNQSEQKVVAVRDLLHAHEQRMRQENERMVAMFNAKIDELDGRSNALDLKLTEIRNMLLNMDGAIREIDYKSEEGATPNRADDATYRFARKLLKEGQSVDVIIQQTNLSRDEINILKNLLV